MLRVQVLGTLLIALLASAVAQQSTMKAEPTAQQKQVVGDFNKRVSDYLSLRKKEAGTSSQTSSPDALEKNQKELTAKIQKARSSAKQGDIFTPSIATYFRKRIAATLKAKQGETIRASLRRSEPLKGVTVKVNEIYPDGVPLQSTPPSLLLNLPQLPKELEYRLVNGDLVLHDIAANLIVDIVPHAIPAQ